MIGDKKEKNEIYLPDPICSSKALIDYLSKQEHFTDLLALYTIYYYTAKWYNIEDTLSLVNMASRLNWSYKKMEETQAILIDLGLFTNMELVDDQGLFIEYYVRITLIWTEQDIQDLRKTTSKESIKIQ